MSKSNKSKKSKSKTHKAVNHSNKWLVPYSLAVGVLLIVFDFWMVFVSPDNW